MDCPFLSKSMAETWEFGGVARKMEEYIESIRFQTKLPVKLTFLANRKHPLRLTEQLTVHKRFFPKFGAQFSVDNL